MAWLEKFSKGPGYLTQGAMCPHRGVLVTFEWTVRVRDPMMIHDLGAHSQSCGGPGQIPVCVGVTRETKDYCF